MKLYTVNGRLLTRSTRWWLLHGSEKVGLYCIHNERLDRQCSACAHGSTA